MMMHCCACLRAINILYTRILCEIIILREIKNSSSRRTTQRTCPPRHPAQSRLLAAAQPPLMPSASSVVVRTVLGSLLCIAGLGRDSNVYLRPLHSSSNIAATAVQCSMLHAVLCLAGSRTAFAVPLLLSPTTPSSPHPAI